MSERNIILSDVLYALKNGIVKRDCEEATRQDYFRYRIESKTPNSEGQTLCVVVIPDERKDFIKVVTVFWANEKQTVSMMAGFGKDENE